jgi:hypothetical protein
MRQYQSTTNDMSKAIGDRFQICKESRCQERLTGSACKSIILAFGKTLELENGQ